MDLEAFIVTHTHWDREWYRPFQAFRYRLVDLLEQVLETIERDPAFAGFLLDGQSVILEDVLAIRPDLEPRVRRAVEGGRLWIGPWYILPDEFLVSGESLIRNLMVGIRIARRFGQWMAIGYTPDPFGHVGQLPQILRGFGIEAAVFQRGLDDQPTLLWWEAPDGTRVFTVYLRDGYGNVAWIPEDAEALAVYLKVQALSLAPHTPVPLVLLMNGTDHLFPHPQLSRWLHAAQAHLPDLRLRHAALEDYINAVRSALGERAKDLTVVRGELRSSKRHPVLPGALSARMWIKQRNAVVQTWLERYAEPLLAFAYGICGLDRRPFLVEAWRLLLQNHFHDSICGTGVDEAHEDMKPRFDHAEQIARLISQEAMGRLLQPAPAEPPSGWLASDPALMAQTLLVYNPIPGSARGPVEVVLPALPSGLTYRLLDEAGEEVPLFELEPGVGDHARWVVSPGEWVEFLSRLLWIHVGRYAARRVWVDLSGRRIWVEWADASADMDHRMISSVFEVGRRLQETQPTISTPWSVSAVMGGSSRWVFEASQLPGVGFQPYRLQIVPGEPRRIPRRPREEPAIENEFFRLTVNLKDGTFDLEDRRTGRRWSGLNRLEDEGDAGDVYNYEPPAEDQRVDRPAEPPRARAWEEGPLGQCLEVKLRYEIPAGLRPDGRGRSGETRPLPITVRAWLRPGVPRVDLETTVENPATDHRLRVVFPTGIRSEVWVTEGAFDTVVRPVGLAITPDETWVEQPVPTAPQQAFAFVEDGSGGFLVANQGLPEIEARKDPEGQVELVLTLLRCVGWLSRGDLRSRRGHAGPPLPTPAAQMIGRWTFRYSLIPFLDRWEAIREAQRFLAPPMAAAGPGQLRERPFIQVEPPAFILTAVKAPEEGEGLIVRGYNASEQPLEVRLTLWRSIREAWRADLMETPREPLQPDGAHLRVPVRPKEILTVRLTV
ncbi:Mannosylglycerate hydrolase [Candidatus Thermoflexus japonica]|uniref:Mannosylglycerate hydrolase n=1 Tax=Candidatus Thermoflexus japonica TaxID=2035417 RepID=A0A2H5Y6T3_9CHLR|nr:Mannosylglycerate hydrolase [Candidatus Thermoflexus japonica]